MYQDWEGEHLSTSGIKERHVLYNCPFPYKFFYITEMYMFTMHDIHRNVKVSVFSLAPCAFE